MPIKLFDSELKVMEILWKVEKMTAKDIAARLKSETGWSKTTSYTVIKKCVDKAAVTREEPGFICRAAITRRQAQEAETEALITRMYDGSPGLLVASLLGGARLKPDEIEKLQAWIQEKTLREAEG